MQQRTHAESLVKHLAEYFDYDVVKIPFYFFRTRMRGNISLRDYSAADKVPRVPICDRAMIESVVRRYQLQKEALAAKEAAAATKQAVALPPRR
jgi:hypothetical protein